MIFKQRGFRCQLPQWLLLLLSKSLLSERATAKHITSVGLCFRVLNRSDKKENIVDARRMLCCLGPQQVKTPQCHSSRLLSCYMHILTHRQLCNQHTVIFKVCQWLYKSWCAEEFCALKHVRFMCWHSGTWLRGNVQGLKETGTSYILWLMARGLTWAVIWEDWSQRTREKWIPPVLLQTQQDSKSDR